jgi:hypothetical protein
LIEHGLQLASGNLGEWIAWLFDRDLVLARLATGGLSFGCSGETVGHLIQPRTYRIVPAQGPGLPGEDEKGSLGRILGIVNVAQHAAADAKYHGAVPPHERCKSRLIVLLAETVQQLAVRQLARAFLRHELADVPKNNACAKAGHDRGSRRAPVISSTYKWLQRGGTAELFPPAQSGSSLRDLQAQGGERAQRPSLDMRGPGLRQGPGLILADGLLNFESLGGERLGQVLSDRFHGDLLACPLRTPASVAALRCGCHYLALEFTRKCEDLRLRGGSFGLGRLDLERRLAAALNPDDALFGLGPGDSCGASHAQPMNAVVKGAAGDFGPLPSYDVKTHPDHRYGKR